MKDEKWGKLPDCIKQAAKASMEDAGTVQKYADQKDRVEDPSVE